ncbi:MAG TPA: citrate/2-methylcitrate synthase [Gaiellaceae bacterium]|nr:citrate/2-methylcitrate synthase [Gaiellaceae bacterium]
MAAKKSVQLSGIVVAESAISSIDPDKGVLMYRGYDIADLAEHSTYEETALLLLDGDLPSSEWLAGFESELAEGDLPGAAEEVIDRSAGEAAPMEMLRTAVSTLSSSRPSSRPAGSRAGRRMCSSSRPKTGSSARPPSTLGRHRASSRHASTPEH